MKRFLLLSTLGMTTACAPSQKVVYPPTIDVQSIQLSGLELPSLGRPAVAHVNLNVQVGNPNPLPVRLAEVRAKLILDGEDVGEVSIPDVQLPAQGRTQQRAQLDLPLTGSAMNTFLHVARGEEVSYRLDGTFTADLGPLGQPRFGPFTFSQGVWKQAVLNLF